MSDHSPTFATTQRGFSIAKFRDRYDQTCSLQKSSLAFEDCIWFGVDDADPRIMASKAVALGLPSGDGTGFVPYPIPSDVLLSTRMHLTQAMVAALLPALQHFAETGDLPSPSKDGRA